MAEENTENYKESEDESENPDEEILRVARERFKGCQDAYVDIHRLGRIDDEYSLGNQWPEDVKSMREVDGRPCLTVNRLSPFIRQVVNDQKQNNPTVTYSPEDDQADVETAKIYQGINRNLEKNSNADGARDWAFDGAARRGFGYWRLITDYVSPTSFLQEIRYQKIFDAYSVFLDPNHVEVDGSDANYGFIHSRLQKDEFCAKYGESKLAKDGDWKSSSSDLADWVNEDSCLVVEYYYKDFKREKLLLLANGESVLESKYKELFKDNEAPAEFAIQKDRETVTEIVKWVKFAGDEILEQTEWPSRWIPIIPSYGEVQIVNGKKVFKSVIRDSLDSQTMFNYFVTAEAEAIGLAPKAPFVGAAGQFEGHEGKWQTANSKPHSFLEYNAIEVGGSPVPPPQRVVAEAQVQAITSAKMQASEDLKSTSGIQDAALGARSNENSGIAIQRRANQAQTSNYHFMANFEQSAKHSGRIVAEIIPVIYDTPRVAKIVGEDGESEVIKINEEFEHKGQLKTYDLSKGKYDLSIDMGPAYATRRQEALSSMMELAKMNPQIMAIAGDLIVKNADWPGAQEIVERIRKTMDPKLLDEGGGQQIPPQVQAQMAQMGEHIQQLSAVNAEQQKLIETKILELESKERMKLMELENAIALKQMDLVPQESMAIVQHELADIHARLSLLDVNQPIQQDPNQNQNLMAPMPDQQGMPSEQQQPTGGFPPS